MTVLAYRRHDISDRAWEKIEPHLPGGKSSWGGITRDNRQFVDAVFWIVRTGAPWRDIPPDSTAEDGAMPIAALSVGATKGYGKNSLKCSPTIPTANGRRSMPVTARRIRMLPERQSEDRTPTTSYGRHRSGGMIPVIPPKRNRKDRHKYDSHLYKARHPVKNTFLHLKRWRGIATRYAKNGASFLAAIHIRCILL